MPAGRRKLTAVDDPLAAGPRHPPAPASSIERRTQEDTVALYVRLRLEEADRLARAAFELRVHKRELVGALIARHVDGVSPHGLEELRRLVEDFRSYRDSGQDA